MRVCRRYTHKIFEILLGFEEHIICTRQRGKYVQIYIDFITLKTLRLSYIQAKHAVKKHLGYKCTSTLIFHPTHYNDTTCTTTCLVQSALTRNIRLKDFLLLTSCSFSYFRLFSPYISSLG